jgi:holo-[acyl-carrier protein] synthase
MGVENARSGQPTLVLAGGAAARLAALTPEGARAVIHLSLTDDHPYAQAFVVIEAVAADETPVARPLAPAGPRV